ncbi:uncharacterized protein LOC122296424 isoform X6 [Carya illinoinensis]|uniref:uncharacterized protein LOC122296424 isoform X6 n=1 Tax=Carya illinoinensis TaxID=32201 RepID=UPI001C726464|nr:uncharacterized protein LOC122296424 isoform X6 [Carya illinoinensis]
MASKFVEESGRSGEFLLGKIAKNIKQLKQYSNEKVVEQQKDNRIDCQEYYCSNGGLLSSKDDYLLCFGDPQRIPRSGKKQLRFHHICQNLSAPFNIYSISKFSIFSPSGLPALVATISLESQEK